MRQSEAATGFDCVVWSLRHGATQKKPLAIAAYLLHNQSQYVSALGIIVPSLRHYFTFFYFSYFNPMAVEKRMVHAKASR